MSKENLVFKLDNLEYQIHYLQGTLNSFQPRLNHTTKLYNVKGRKNQKRLQQKLNDLNEKKLLKEVDLLRVTILNNKIHNAEKHLTSFFEKALKSNKDVKIDEAEIDSKKFIASVIVSKLVKLTRSKVTKMIKIKGLTDIPNWYSTHEFETIWNDKSNDKNPSYIWNNIVLKIDGASKFISSSMNQGKVKEIMSTYENGINVLLGIAVREPKKQEVKEKEPEEVHEKADEDEDESSDEGENISAREDIVPDQDIDEDVLKQYDTLLVDSENEQDDNGEVLDENINYNEVTDEEPSDEESDSDSETTEKKYNLPQLLNGYYSGDEDSDASDIDETEAKLVKEQTAMPQKKNRRGQRARRRIWAQKYGREANHVQKEIQEKQAEREKRQREYEERVEKRAAKQAKSDKTNANLIPIANAKRMGMNNGTPVAIAAVKPNVNENHPSWVAKKQAEEKLKNAKFSGKKITFD